MDIVKMASLKALETRFAAHVLHLHNTEAVSYLDSEGFCVRQAFNGSAVRLKSRPSCQFK
jgi:hypothetical protein